MAIELFSLAKSSREVDAAKFQDELKETLWHFGGDMNLLSDQWILESKAKSAIANWMYSPLLADTGKKLNVVDVGGSLSHITGKVSRIHNVTVIDPVFHESEETVEDFCTLYPNLKLIRSDWYTSLEASIIDADAVIANDIFPNVDQRLDAFLSIVSSVKSVKMTLTVYPNSRFYVTKRIDADEHLTVAMWDGQQAADTLKKNGYVSDAAHLSELDELPFDSDWPNGRKVFLFSTGEEL